MNLFRVLAELERARRTAFERWLRETCTRGVTVVLFGSRVRGTHHALSDFDVAVITDGGDYRVERAEFGEVFHVPVERLGEVLNLSVVILDIALDGKVLCGDAARFEALRDAALRYIEERGLVKTDSGWLPAGQGKA